MTDLEHSDPTLRDEKDLSIVTPEDDLRDRFTYADSKRLLRKADWHILPILIFLYTSKGMDTSMTSFVATLNKGKNTNILKYLGTDTDKYAFAATVYYVTYIIFEVPSNLIVKWSTPRLHFLRITLFWSVVTMCTAAAHNIAGFLTARAFLGVAEAGLLPGMYWHLTCWYRPDEIAIRLNILAILGSFASILDSFLTYGLSFVDGHGGLAAWQWSYLVVGLLGLPFTVWIYFSYPDFPDSPPSRRQFLTHEEGAFMVARLPPNSARSSDLNVDWAAIRRELRSPLFYGFALFNLCMASCNYGLSFWLPTIISSFGLSHGATTQLLNIPTAAAFIIVTLAIAYFMDHNTRVPKPVIIYSGATGLIGMFVGMIFCKSKAGLYVLIILAQAFLAVMIAPIWVWRSQTFKGSSSAAFSLAVQNTSGQIPGLYTAQFFRSKYAPGYAVSYGVSIVFIGALVIVTSFLWYLTWHSEKETRDIARLRHAVGKDNVVAKEDVHLN
ncbi:MFS general substrate transporter [Naematelia encephala]|uniref:MFS general substrate transporter n=1 Tax=Naematelia encephala TaxID=71784 RepID=A0A1Y2AJW1_9TREE|nr:MFS general substrate transporter [Naematelia encephala]